MSLKRIAEELEALGNEQEDKELDETLAACGFKADDDIAPEDKDEVIFKDEEDDSDEIKAMIASVGKEAAVKDDFVVEGVNGYTQDEFTQVQGITENGGGQEDYPSVADAAKKLASIARHLASVKEEAEKTGESARYAKYFNVLEKTIMKKASVLRKAVADKTPFSGDLGHDGARNEKDYGAYDKSEGEEDFTKRDLDGDSWKDDAHDETGFGIPKKEADIPKLASIRLAANKSVQLAVCLLGNKAPEDVIEAQGRDFFASMDLSAIDRGLKRYAETADLYEKKEEVAPVVEDKKEEVTAQVEAPKEEIKVNDVKEEISASKEEAAPAVEEKKVEEVAAADAPFSVDEEKEIQAMVASVKARKAKLAAEAARRVAEEELKETEVKEEKTADVAPEAAPVADEVKDAAKEDSPAIEETANEEVLENDEILLTGASDEADAVVEPELDGIFDTDEGKVVASAKKVTKCAQKIPTPKIASVEADELSQLWADDGDSVFK